MYYTHYSRFLSQLFLLQNRIILINLISDQATIFTGFDFVENLVLVLWENIGHFTLQELKIKFIRLLDTRQTHSLTSSHVI